MTINLTKTHYHNNDINKLEYINKMHKFHNIKFDL